MRYGSSVTWLAVFTLLWVSATSADVIKQSSSGLCHPPHSPWYERTRSYIVFDTVDDCLDAGGRLPDGVAGDQKQASSSTESGYSRSRFGHGWEDESGNGLNTRMEALIALSTIPVTFADDNPDRVVRGRWISPFTNAVIFDASEMDADHLVPLSYAWHRGADQWTEDRRIEFANDLVNIWPVELSLNRQKQDKGIEDWLPPANQCSYIARFVRIIKIYRITPSPSEREAHRQLLSQCKR